MDDRLLQQLKKGVLEMLVLEVICQEPTYGYELMAKLRVRSGDLFTLKEGTLITASWSQGEGRTAPKKIYAATEKGLQERQRRFQIWKDFYRTVNGFYREETE